MKTRTLQTIQSAIETLENQGILDAGTANYVQLERARQSGHGDFACNIAMILSKQLKKNPREIAQMIVDHLPESELIESVDIAGPGFINLTVSKSAYLELIDQIRDEKASYGQSEIGKGQRVMVEFVSANPTGPLHVGHGRGAAYGDALARVLKTAGYSTHSEYYVNDAGRQMDILALSIWLRYLELNDVQSDFPQNGYKGDYIWDIAKSLNQAQSNQLVESDSTLFENLPTDKEESIDELIARCKLALGAARFRALFDHGCSAIVADIRQDLEEFGVHFEEWFSERSVVEGGDLEQAILTMEKNGHIYELEGAKWFRATDFGDEKDRVVMRANGSHTYFASDIAYHFSKAERGFDQMIDIFGADHHGYVKRIKASLPALGHAEEKLNILLVQFAVLYRGGEKVSMSTRGGDFVTLRELRNEVGNDASRFFYVMRKPDQHMDFDLDLAKSQSSENPVYYVQYAHARICSVFRQLREKGMATPDSEKPDYALLTEEHEYELLQTLSRYPEVIELAARSFEPHQIAFYLRDLANRFHTYYNAHPFLSSENNIRLARLGLIDATRQVIKNGLSVIGVSAPESM